MWEQLLQREVVISLAVIGAIAATAGSVMRNRAAPSAAGLVLYWGGYTVTGISIALFIIAGLVGVKP